MPTWNHIEGRPDLEKVAMANALRILFVELDKLEQAALWGTGPGALINQAMTDRLAEEWPTLWRSISTLRNLNAVFSGQFQRIPDFDPVAADAANLDIEDTS